MWWFSELIPFSAIWLCRVPSKRFLVDSPASTMHAYFVLGASGLRKVSLSVPSPDLARHCCRHRNFQFPEKNCMTKCNEIKMDEKLRSAKLKTENKKQTVFDSKGPSDLRFGFRHKKGSRVMRCVTLTTPAKTVARRRSSRARDVSESESSNRSSMCLCHCRFWKKSSQ